MSVFTGLHTGSPSEFDPGSWWNGYQLIIPGQGEQDLLGNADATTKATYPAVTKNHWRLSCINEAQTANGVPGDGFIAHAPDGTAYYFNELISYVAPGVPATMAITSGTLARPGQMVQPGTATSTLASASSAPASLGTARTASPLIANGPTGLARDVAYLLVTKVVDRFGNSLTYTYNTAGLLTNITASDGRALSITYGTYGVASVTLQPGSGAARTWTYSYAAVQTPEGSRQSLVGVTLPDGTQWHYDFSAFDGLHETMTAPGTSSCNTLGPLNPNPPSPATATITAPSGLTGTFTVTAMEHARSFVPSACHAPAGTQNWNGDTIGTWADTPRAWYSYTVTQRTLSGAGLPASPGEVWAYSYSTPQPSWVSCTGSCPTTEWTEVVRPDGTMVKRTFSNKYDRSEGHLLQTDFYATASAPTPLRSVINTYVDPSDPNAPVLPQPSAGGALTWRINSEQATEFSPVYKRVIEQDSDSYTWLAESFDDFVQVTKDKRFNSIAGQTAVEATTSYHNDTAGWVLGQVDTQTNLTAGGEVVNQYDYNADDLITSRSHFGQQVMTYAWTAGQLASFTDADGHTTTLGSYKRGIPQSISFPDGTSESLDVDDLGEITSITNQAGNTTQYAYDSVGRLTSITYPTGGVSWYPTTFQYQYVTTTDRGIPGGHWERTVSQGNARHVTYYDALLRPILASTYITGDSSSNSNVRTMYNWQGQATWVSVPFAGWPDLGDIAWVGTATTYDALGRTISVAHATPELSSNATAYIAYLSGARKQVTDPNGNITTTSYQAFDEPSDAAPVKVVAPEGVVQTITRNVYGDPVAMTQSGPDGTGGTLSETKYWYYNLQHRLCRWQEPETGSTQLGYDAAGNLTWSADGQTVSGTGCGTQPGAVTTRAYDALNRLTAVNHPDSEGDTTTSYDAMGQVTQAAS